MPRRRVAAPEAALFSTYSYADRSDVKRQEESLGVTLTVATPSVENTSSPEPTQSPSVSESVPPFSGTSSLTENASTSQVPTPTKLNSLPSQSLPPPAPPIESEPALSTFPPQQDVTSTLANPTPSSEVDIPPVVPSTAVPSISPSDTLSIPTPSSEPSSSPDNSNVPPVSPVPSSAPPTPDAPSEPSISLTPGPTNPPLVPGAPEPSGVVPSISPVPSPSPTIPPSPPVVTNDPVAPAGNPPTDGVFSSGVDDPNTVATVDVPDPNTPVSTPSVGIPLNNAGGADVPLSRGAESTVSDIATATRLAINAVNTDVPLVVTEEIATVIPSTAADGSIQSVTVSTIRTRTTGAVPTVVATTEAIPAADRAGASTQAAVIGGVIGGVVALLLLGVFLLVWLRRRASRRKALNGDFIFAQPNSSSLGKSSNSEPSMMERGRLSALSARVDPFRSPDRMGSLSPVGNPFDDPFVAVTTKPWVSARTTRSSGGSWDQGNRTSQASVGVAV